MKKYSMPSSLNYLSMILKQVGKQELARQPEPEQVSDGVEQSLQYQSVKKTKLTIAYALGLEILHRTLSGNMLAKAEQTKKEMALEGVLSFKKGDIRNLSDLPDQSVNFSTFSDAAHHMPTLGDVQKVLVEMSRVTRKDGVVFLMDVVRLRNKALTEAYVSAG